MKIKYTTTINKNQAMYRRDYSERNNVIKGFFIGVLFAIIVGLFTTNANARDDRTDTCSEYKYNITRTVKTKYCETVYTGDNKIFRSKQTCNYQITKSRWICSWMYL